jgi:hypothetical protein
MDDFLDECHHCGAAYPSDVDHHCVEGKVDEVREAVQELKEVVEAARAQGVPVTSFGGAGFYAMIGIGWGYAVAGKTDPITGAVQGLFWPVSAAFQLASFYWR